ncbi:MAG: type II toxin-antitoxin system RelE/ParE family toxin [Pirellulales bacterium]
MKLRIDPEAEAETREAAVWYERERAGLGLELLAAVDSAVQRIRQTPERFPRLETLPDEENVRRLLLQRFPYAIIYETTQDGIRILAVAHTRRSPDYWKDRR